MRRYQMLMGRQVTEMGICRKQRSLRLCYYFICSGDIELEGRVFKKDEVSGSVMEEVRSLGKIKGTHYSDSLLILIVIIPPLRNGLILHKR